MLAKSDAIGAPLGAKDAAQTPANYIFEPNRGFAAKPELGPSFGPQDATQKTSSVFGPQGMKRSVAADIFAPSVSPPRAAPFELGPAPLGALGQPQGQYQPQGQQGQPQGQGQYQPQQPAAQPRPPQQAAALPRRRPSTPDLDELPSIGDDKPAVVASKGLGLRAEDLRAPSFVDEIDDDDLAAEEEAFMARMRAEKEGKSKPQAAPARLPSPPAAPASPPPAASPPKAAPTAERSFAIDRSPAADVRYADSKTPAPEPAFDGNFLGPSGHTNDDIDDLSEEEIL